MKSTYKPEVVKHLFKDSAIFWWVAGGWALDLFLGIQSREHEDLDITVLRKDERKVRNLLQDWHLQIGLGEGKLENYILKNEISLPKNREIIWCKPNTNSNWAFELLLSRSEDVNWIFKRDDRIKRPIEDIGELTDSGIPYLKPEIVLLFKAKSPEGKNNKDFMTTYPLLNSKSSKWLAQSIRLVHPNHPWLKHINE